MLPISSDNHIHPFERTKNKAGMRRFAERAAEVGLKEITFTEHAPHVPGLCGHGMNEDELEAYIAYTRELQAEMVYPRIKLGIEADWHISNYDYLKSMFKKYKFDYVIGSVHIHSSVYQQRISSMSLKEIGILAIQQNIAALQTGMFDAIAHLDFFRWLNDQKRFGQWTEDYCPEDYIEEVKELFSLMERSNTYLEINASGLYKHFKSILPSSPILREAANYNLNYIYGSDAHTAELVGSGQTEVIAALSTVQRNALHDYNQKIETPMEEFGSSDRV